jgi:hypothetical protein
MISICKDGQREYFDDATAQEIASQHAGPKDTSLIECLERITLALQGIELAFDKHNEHSGYDKDNQKLEKLLQQGDDE